jgi:hypothetical protein
MAHNGITVSDRCCNKPEKIMAQITHIEMQHIFWGGSTEAEICRDVISRPRVVAAIFAASCDERLPASAMGYVAQLRGSETIAVATDAAAMIRRHIPEFLAGIV